MSSHRYRYTVQSLNVGFVFGVLSATALPGPVLVLLLGALGTSESAARNLLTVSVRRGMLTSRRAGRFTVYRMSPTSLAGYRQVEGSATEPTWAGHFHALIYDVPETHRAVRDRIRYAADYAGYGLLRPGLLISPEDRRERFAGLLTALPADCRMYAATLQPPTLDEARAMTRDAWDLTALADRYRAAARRLQATDPEPDTSVWTELVRWNAIYHQLLELKLSDPALPPELLPARWPRAEFDGALNELNWHWAPRLQPELRARAAEVDPAGLAEYYRSPFDPPGGTG